MKYNLKTLLLITLLFSSLYSEPVPIYNIFKNLTYENSKNSILGGATTATAKGYAALSSNPAGLSSNYNFSAYLKTIVGETIDVDGTVLSEFSPDYNSGIGLVYDSYALEIAPNNYLTLGAAYGHESIYGLFSVGFSYKIDQTTLGNDDTSQGDDINKIYSATGNYITYGLMWQKTFLDEEDFYSFYFGYSYKNSGLNNSNVNLPYRSASRRNIGIGLETNIYDNSILFTLDFANEFFQTPDSKGNKPSSTTTAIGVKWMISHKFAIGLGQSSQTFSENEIADIETSALGIEWGIWGMHIMPSFTNMIANTEDGPFIEERAMHLDVAFTF